MNKKYLLLSLDDSRMKNIAEILGNKTSNKMIDFLSELKEASEKDISDGLKIPLNTVGYNLKKMIQAGIVEETRNFFWSAKGKKIKMYKFANKSILISPKQKKISSDVKQILPVALLSGIAAAGIKYYFADNQIANSQDAGVALYAMQKTTEVGNNFISSSQYYWLWFLAGTFFSIALFIIVKTINRRREYEKQN